jgi:hypothetical protein
MRIIVLRTPDAAPTLGWVRAELTRRGHEVVAPGAAVDTFTTAADIGRVVATDLASHHPDVLLALGWEAALAAQVAARESGTPVVLRLPRVGRARGDERDRLEVALARGSRSVLVPSAGELDRLVDRGVARAGLRVLPDAVDREQFPDGSVLRTAAGLPRVGLVVLDDAGPERQLAQLPGWEPVVLPVDPDDAQRPALLRTVDAVLALGDSAAEVMLVLQAMSTGVPVVALDTGVLSDLVADGVTGLLVARPAAVPEALRALLSDPMRQESMGLAAVDRVRARFDTAVVGPVLERLLREALPEEEAAAS